MRLLKTAIFSACLAIPTTIPTTGIAAPKVYSGAEAQAIRCAQLVFFVAREGDRLGFLSRNDQDGLKAYGLYLLNQYTSGTPRQKAKAIENMSKATAYVESVQKFEKSHRRCIRQFPIR